MQLKGDFILRFNKVRYLFYALILLGATYLRFSQGVVTLLDPDAIGYINPALSFLESGHFEHTYARSYPYPAFCLIMFALVKHIDIIAITQHVLGLLGGLGLIFFIERRLIKTGIGFWINLMVSFFTLLFVSLVMLDVNLILFEKTFRPEGLIFPSLLLYTWFTFRYFEKPSLPSSYTFIFLFMVYSFMLILLHPRLTIGLYCVLVLVCFYELKKRKFTISKGFMPLFSLIFLGFILVMFPEKFLIERYDRTSPAFAYKQFYYSNVPIVLKALNDGHLVLNEYDKEILPQKLNVGLSQENSVDFFLGYNIDFIMTILINTQTHKGYV